MKCTTFRYFGCFHFCKFPKIYSSRVLGCFNNLLFVGGCFSRQNHPSEIHKYGILSKLIKFCGTCLHTKNHTSQFCISLIPLLWQQDHFLYAVQISEKQTTILSVTQHSYCKQYDGGALFPRSIKLKTAEREDKL